MRPTPNLPALLLGAFLSAACSAEEADPRGACGPVDLAPLAGEPHYAVVMSDYQSTAISMLGADAEVLSLRWLDSGTRDPQVIATLSGDVVLPSQNRNRCQLTLIDRLGADIISLVDLCTDNPLSAPIQQFRAQLSVSDAAAFRSNPQDLLRPALGSHYWLTR